MHRSNQLCITRTQTDEPMALCRRFCMTAWQCNQTRFKESDECDRLKFLNKGNTVRKYIYFVEHIICLHVAATVRSRVTSVVCIPVSHFDKGFMLVKIQMLVDCTQKCTVRDNGNFEAKCTELSPGYCGKNLTLSTGDKAAEAPPTPIAAIVAPIAAFVLLCICACIYILYKRRQSKV